MLTSRDLLLLTIGKFKVWVVVVWRELENDDEEHFDGDILCFLSCRATKMGTHHDNSPERGHHISSHLKAGDCKGRRRVSPSRTADGGGGLALRLPKEEKEGQENDVATVNASEGCRDQERVVKAAVAGASIFITGIAGSGKTHVLDKIIKLLKDLHGAKGVWCTGTTGVVAAALPGGMTLHSFAGLGIGTMDAYSLARQAGSGSSKQRWEQCKVLVIDEVGMMDGHFFTKLEHVARIVRNSRAPFGGIQLILVGDLYQLPPVAAKSWVFESEAWTKCIDYHMELKTNFRQRDKEFSDILSRVRQGECTPFDYIFFQKLSVLPKSIGLDPDSGIQLVPTKIFAQNSDVDVENEEQLKLLPGPTVVYHAIDSTSDTEMYKNCSAPKVLRLRPGAQVMLLKNIDATHGLANGTKGVVICFNKDWDNAPMVDIKGMDHLVTLAAEDFSGSGNSSRLQIPLRLAWALTIHKAQGSTLDSACIDLRGVKQPGQAYVALSRVRTSKGLKVVNFSPDAIRVDKKVKVFMNNVRVEPSWSENVCSSSFKAWAQGPKDEDEDEDGWQTSKKKKKTVKSSQLSADDF